MTPIQNQSPLILSTWTGANHASKQYEEHSSLSSVDQTETSLGSWTTNKGIITLKLSPEGNLVAFSSSQTLKPIPEMWITGIPKGLKEHPEQLKNYLSKTYIHIGSLGECEGKLYIHPKLRGGMMAAATAGLSAVSSTMGFFTSGNYVRLAAEAGKQAQATLRVAGQECRATIQTAEESAANTITRARFAVDQSINTAKNATTEVLRTARTEIDAVVAGAGIEARHTARIMELQVEKALREAGRTAEATFAKAGLEARQTIQLAGEEARDTTTLVSQQVSANITHAREQTSALVTECSAEAQALIERTRVEALAVIQGGGADVQQRVNQIIEAGIQQLDECTTRTIQLASGQIENLVHVIANEVNTIILNAGEQGRLIMREAGHEFQFRATNVLASAGEQVQIVMQEAGVQGSLLIREAGQMVHGTLNRLPEIAARTARLVGRNLVVGIRQGLIGVSQVDQIVHSIMDYCDTTTGDDVEGPAKHLTNLIEYIVEQHQLRNPRHKVLLYRTLIQVMNTPGLSPEVRRASYLLIGATACRDPDLIERSGFCRFIFGARDLSQEVIEEVPGEARQILRDLRENAMDHFIELQPVPEVEHQNPEEVAAQQLAQQQREVELAHLNQLANLQLRIDEMQVRADEAAAQMADLQARLAGQEQEAPAQPQVDVEAIRAQIAGEFQGQIVAQERLVGQLQRELEHVRGRPR